MERGPLQDAKLAKLSTDYVACRMTGGTKDPSPGISEFMARYSVQGYPTLLVLSAEGGVLAEDFGRDPAAILAAMEEANRAEADFQKFKSAALAATDPALRLGLAQLHLARKEFGAAVPILKAVAEQDPSPYRWRKLAEAQLGMGDSAAALATYDKLLAADPSLDNRFLKAGAQVRGGDVDGALAGLKAALEKADDATKADAKERTAALLLDHIIRLCNEKGDFKGALKPLDMLLNDYGDTGPANQARRFAGQIRQMAGG